MLGKAQGGRQQPCPLCPGLVSLARLWLAATLRPLSRHRRACPWMLGWGWGWGWSARMPSWSGCILAAHTVLTAASENVNFLSRQDFS